MSTYTATFDRIGRHHDIQSLEVTGDADQIAETVYRYARKFLGSRDVDVHVDLEEMHGHIYCGFHTGGTFTLAAATP